MSGNGWWRHARSAAGNVAVAPATAGRAHRASRCRDDGCLRPLCQAYREDGYEHGYEHGWADGYRAGAAAAQAR